MHRIYAAAIPAGRIGRPAEIAAACVLLASPAAAACAGHVVNPNDREIRCSL
jgi:NAD(P)-dependent dehydrogenase (short-subunit alcohol dehydrogenase family)